MTTKLLTTFRGTVFPIKRETDHYVWCGEPQNAADDTVAESLLDFDDLYKQGYRLCSIMRGGMFVGGPFGLIFEKIKPPADQIEADLKNGKL